jgi:hypothetical protein
VEAVQVLKVPQAEYLGVLFLQAGAEAVGEVVILDGVEKTEILVDQMEVFLSAVMELV